MLKKKDTSAFMSKELWIAAEECFIERFGRLPTALEMDYFFPSFLSGFRAGEDLFLCDESLALSDASKDASK